MVPKAKKRKLAGSKKRFIGKPNGQIQQRVQDAGPERFSRPMRICRLWLRAGLAVRSSSVHFNLIPRRWMNETSSRQGTSHGDDFCCLQVWWISKLQSSWHWRDTSCQFLSGWLVFARGLSSVVRRGSDSHRIKSYQLVLRKNRCSRILNTFTASLPVT